MAAKFPCMIPGCDRAQKCRGHCNSHYAAIVRYVSEGRVTWATLEAEGKVLPAKPSGRPAGRPHRPYGAVRDFILGTGASDAAVSTEVVIPAAEALTV